MKLQRFDNPELFQDAVQDFLLENEAENNLPLGVLANVISGDYIETTPYMSLLEDGGNPVLVMMCTPPYPVYVYIQGESSKPSNSYRYSYESWGRIGGGVHRNYWE